MPKGVALKTILDDRGNRWIIEKGDPGYAALMVARRLRLKRPTLPYEVCAGHPLEPLSWNLFDELIEVDIVAARAAYVANLIRGQLWSTTGIKP